MEDHLQGMALLLAQEHILDNQELLHHQRAAFSQNLRLLTYLVINHLVNPSVIAGIISNHYNLPRIDLNTIDLTEIPITPMHETLIRRYHVLPIATRTNQMDLALDDPSQPTLLKEIQFHARVPLNLLIADTDQLTKCIEQWLCQQEGLALSHYFETHRASTTNQHNLDNDDAPVAQFINKLLLEAIKQGVSDVHFEPYEQSFRIRYRLDGLLREVATPPLTLASRLAARIKMVANLDIAETRHPQDGRFRMTVSNTQYVDFRVSTCPTVSGEKIVLRLLNPNLSPHQVHTLGLTTQQKQLFLEAIRSPQGMILITGPTGSGKTMTLYAALNQLNTPEKNICTTEDPVEIQIPGIHQVNVHPRIGLTFSHLLRSFLRQDPDVIMVGEIRDLETAEIAINAAQTGHLVLSTLHTNSAADTLTRLINLGIPAFHIASSIRLIIAQRLIRRLCIHCRTLCHDIPSSTRQTLGLVDNIPLYHAIGCDRCHHGYHGRIGLFEVMPISNALMSLIMSGGNPKDLLKQAQIEGMYTLYQSGLEHIKAGLTTLEEIQLATMDHK